MLYYTEPLGHGKKKFSYELSIFFLPNNYMQGHIKFNISTNYYKVNM